MSQYFEPDVDSDEEEEFVPDEEFKKKEEINRKQLEEVGIRYDIHSIWDWNDEDKIKINDGCCKIGEKYDIEIQYLDKTFTLKGHSFEKMDGARSELIKLIYSKSSNAKQILVSRPKKKNTAGKANIISPLLDLDTEETEETTQPMIDDDYLKSLKGVFVFKTQKRHINAVLGRDILTCDYWRDICKECNVTGTLNEDRKRIEIATGKRKDVKEAIRKLELLEDNFNREQFNEKRIPVVHFPSQKTSFNLYFRPRSKKEKEIDNKDDEDSEDYYENKNIYFLDYTLPRELTDPNSQRRNLDTFNAAKMLRDFNFNKMKEFKEGLEYVRVHKGEVRFNGCLGESWFSNVDYNTGKSLWKYTDLDNLISVNGVKSGFKEIATHNYDLAVKVFTEALGTPTRMSEYFEINADARNAPYGKYSDVYMNVNVGQASLEKVMLKWKPLVNVDWTILNRKYDFSTILATRRIIRDDVKPFSTFKKKISVSPENEVITVYNVVDFLHVKSINFKQVSKFKLHKSFIAELSCIEDVPLQVINDKVLGKTGEGKAHFTIEIYDDEHRKKFRENVSLGTGETVKWTVDDILGEEPDLKNLVDLVRAMLLLVEKCHDKTLKLEEDGLIK